jgi:hypothetical protein
LACATADHIVGTVLAVDLAGSAVRRIFAIDGAFIAAPDAFKGRRHRLFKVL